MGADSKQKIKFLITARKPLFESIFIHKHETRVYWPIFIIRTVFYQFFGTTIFGLDYAKMKVLHKGSKYLKFDQNPNKKREKKRFSPQIFTERCIYDSLTQMPTKRKNSSFCKVFSEKIYFWLLTSKWVFFNSTIFRNRENWFLPSFPALCGTVTSMRYRNTLEPVVPCWMCIFGRKCFMLCCKKRC